MRIELSSWEPSSDTERDWRYNALDCMITLDVLQALLPQLDPFTQATYDLARSLQAPIFAMECRGVRIDEFARRKLIEELKLRQGVIRDQLQRILFEGVGIDWEFNPGSPKQCQKLFYEVMNIPPVKSKGRVSTDEKALNRLASYFHAEPIVRCILEYRDIQKKCGTLSTGLDSDGRMRTSYNIAGTATGRLSSYESPFGTGTNLQNITDELRRMFIADKGMKFAYIDLEQAESRVVGAIIWNLFQDGGYLDACESGDLHTSVCRLCWTDLLWTGDLRLDKIIAKQKFYRHFDYRDAGKRLGHATNYFGKPPQIANEVHIEYELVRDFQKAYFSAFPFIGKYENKFDPADHQNWHSVVRARLRDKGYLTSLMGRRRWFFGRRWDDETLRSAIAYDPQSSIADVLDKGMLQLFRSDLNIQLLLQVHDAVLIQYPEELEDEILPKALQVIKVEIPLAHGRSLLIPTEAAVGWNWAKTKNNKGELTNPDGLVPYAGHDERKRIFNEAASIMDARV